MASTGEVESVRTWRRPGGGWRERDEKSKGRDEEEEEEATDGRRRDRGATTDRRRSVDTAEDNMVACLMRGCLLLDPKRKDLKDLAFLEGYRSEGEEVWREQTIQPKLVQTVTLR